MARDAKRLILSSMDVWAAPLEPWIAETATLDVLTCLWGGGGGWQGTWVGAG